MFEDEFDGMDEFAGARDGFPRIEDVLGRLVLVKPLKTGERESTIKGSKKTYEWVKTECHIIDGEPDEMHFPELPAVLDDFEFQGARMVPALLAKLPRAGRRAGWVLGRVGQGQAQRGQSAPWIWIEPTEQDKAIARKYVASVREKAAVKGVDAASDNPFA